MQTAEPSTGRISPTTAIERLRTLREEAANPRALYRSGEAQRESWKQRVLAVMSRSLGQDADLTTRMRDNRYGLMMFTTDTPESAWAEAFASGVETAKGYIDAAIYELELIPDPVAARAASQPDASATPEAAPISDPRLVWVIHGRNTAARRAMFDLLRAMDLRPMEFSVAVRATGQPSPYVGEVLRVAFENAACMVVLMTPDDEARLRSPFQREGDPPHETNLTGQARPNVLFEAGMAMAYGENRTILVEIGQCRPFSDVAGRHTLRLDNSTQRRQELGQRLELAGAAVDMSGTDWHTAGDFAAALGAASPDSEATESDGA